jgi:hypothetical protein
MSLRILTAAVALFLFAAAPDLFAQTVIVRSAQPQATVEASLNAGTPVKATADQFGDATLALAGSNAEADVQLRVDSCGNVVRVFVVSPGQQPPAAEPGCTRSDLWGVYAMRPVTTFVVEMSGASAAVYVAQGPPPFAWVDRGTGRRGRMPWAKPSNGLRLSAGVGAWTTGQAADATCGNVTNCETSSFGAALTVGAEYWFTRNVAASIAYVKPGDISVAGGGSGFNFESRRTTRMLTVGGKVGGDVGSARLYALGGLNRHEATSNMTQTNDPVTVTVDGVSQTFAGGTQSFGEQTQGWNWMVGGGVEAWMTRWTAFYAEFTRAKLKGSPTSGADGGINEQANLIFVGIKFRVPRP